MTTDDDCVRILEHLGATRVVADTLPDTHGVTQPDKPGRWNGWELPGLDEPYGWTKGRNECPAYSALHHWAEQVGWLELLGRAIGKEDEK